MRTVWPHHLECNTKCQMVGHRDGPLYHAFSAKVVAVAPTPHRHVTMPSMLAKLPCKRGQGRSRWLSGGSWWEAREGTRARAPPEDGDSGGSTRL